MDGDEDAGRPDEALAGGLPLEQARALVERLQADALIVEAEQTAHEVRHLTVVHGDPESGEEEQLHRLHEWAWRHRERARFATRATNDITTWLLAGPEAEVLVDELAALADQLNPGWWRIRRSAR